MDVIHLFLEISGLLDYLKAHILVCIQNNGNESVNGLIKRKETFYS